MTLSLKPPFSFEPYMTNVDGQSEQKGGPTLVKYIPTVGKEETKTYSDVTKRTSIRLDKVRFHCITFIKEYSNKSLEELRLEDYKAGRVTKGKVFETFLEKFKPGTGQVSNRVSPVKKTGAVVAHEILSRRCETKIFKPRKRCGVGKEDIGTTIVKYRPTVGTEQDSQNKIVKFKINCITAMKEYENKSLEELRLEDYRTGRNFLTKYYIDGFDEINTANKPSIFVFGYKQIHAFSFRGNVETDSNTTDVLRFHNVHGVNIKLSNDGTTAEQTNSHFGGVAFSYTPIAVNEKVYLRLVEISANFGALTGICFGFTTNNPGGIAHTIPKFGTPTKNSWLIHLSKELCKKDNILHYYVNSKGEIHFAVNGRSQNRKLIRVDINRPLWAVIDFCGSCQKVQFVGPEALDEVRQTNQNQVENEPGPSNQIVDGVRRPNQIEDNGAGPSNQVVDGVRRPNQIEDNGAGPSNQVVDGVRRPNQIEDNGAGPSNQVVDGVRRPHQIEDNGAGPSNQVVDGVRRPNQNEGNGAGPSNQVLDGVRRLNQNVDNGAGPSNQVGDGVRRPNQNEDNRAGPSNQNKVGNGTGPSNQVVNAVRRPNQAQVENLIGQTNQNDVENLFMILIDAVDGLIRPNQSEVEEVTEQLNQNQIENVTIPNQVIDGVRRPNQVVYGSRRSNQVADDVRRPNQSEVEYDPLVNELRSLSVAEPLSAPRQEPVPLFLHRIKGRNVYYTGRGVAARFAGEYCQGYVFSSRPLRPGKTVTVQILATDERYHGSLAIGLTSCNPGNLRPDELPDEAEFLCDRPEYWVVHLNAAEGLQNGDELTFSLTFDGKLEVRKNGPTPAVVLHVDHTLKLWAFVNIYGYTKEVRLLISDGVRIPQENRIRPANVTENAVSLPSTSKSNSAKNTEFKSSKNTEFSRTECAVCFDKQIDSVLYKCGHMCMCYDCAVQQWRNDGRSYGKCPICRAKIQDVIRTYKP